MKRALSLALTAAMLAGTIAGCGGGSTGSTEKTADTAATQAAEETAAAPAETGSADGNMVFAWWGNQVRNEVTQNALDLYAEKNGVTIEGQFSEWGDYWDKLATSAAGNALPEIIQMDYKYLNQYVQNGLLLDLSPYIEDGTLNLDDCDQNLVAAGTVDGKVYAICHGINSPALLYNKKVTDEAGVTIKDNMTWDEFLDVCRTVYEKTGYKTNVSYYVGDNFVEYYLRSNDVVVYPEGGKLGGTADDYTEFLSIYENGIKEGWMIDPSVFAELQIGSVEQDPLVYGASPETRSWCGFAYTNQLTAERKAAPEDADIQMTTWPAKDPKKSNYMKPGQFISVSATAADPKKAVEFVNWWTNDVEANTTLQAERGVPLSSKVADGIKDALAEGNPDYAEIAKFLNDVVSPNSSQINPPAANGSSEASQLLNEYEEKVCYGEMTAAEAGAEFFEKGNEIMANGAK